MVNPIPMKFCVGHSVTVSVVLVAFGLSHGWMGATTALDTWHLRTTPLSATDDIRGVTFGNGVFVALVEKDGRVLVSPDGKQWELHTTGDDETASGIAYGNGRFVAVGSDGTAYYSSDGASWTPSETDTSVNFNSITFANNLFLVPASSGRILTSPNGADWTIYETATTNYWEGITFAAGRYVAVGWEWKTANARHGVTTDFVSWDIGFSGFERYFDRAAFGHDKFVAVGYGSTAVSTTGTEWLAAENPVQSWLHDVVFANETFVAVGEFGAIASSPNGTDWTRHDSGTRETLWGVVFGNDTFVAVGQDNTILQTDAVGTPSPGLVLFDPRAENGGFSFKFDGEVGQSYQVEATVDFATWLPVTNVEVTSAPVVVSDTSPLAGRRFYRVVKP